MSNRKVHRCTLSPFALLSNRMGEEMHSRLTIPSDWLDRTHGDDCFVAMAGNKPGILIEHEFVTIEADGEAEAMDLWNHPTSFRPTEDVVFAILEERFTRLATQYPETLTWVLTTDGVWNGRVAIQCFVPMEETLYIPRLIQAIMEAK